MLILFCAKALLRVLNSEDYVKTCNYLMSVAVSQSEFNVSLIDLLNQVFLMV